MYFGWQENRDRIFWDRHEHDMIPGMAFLVRRHSQSKIIIM